MDLQNRSASMSEVDMLGPNSDNYRDSFSMPDQHPISASCFFDNRGEQLLEIAGKKDITVADSEDFLRLYNQVLMSEKQNPLKKQTNKTEIKKRISMKKDQETEKPVSEESKKQAIMKKIQHHITHYRANNPAANSGDTEVAKLRTELKQKVFINLMYGVQEIKAMNEGDLNDGQKKVYRMIGKDPYALAKSKSIQLDIDFLNALNSGNKQIASKKYKSFVRSFMKNIAQEANMDLRRKIIAHEWSGIVLAGMGEEQFYPPHLRELVREKQSALLREASVTSRAASLVNEENEHVPVVETKQVIEEKARKQWRYKHIDEGSVSLLRQFMGQSQLVKMRNLIQFEERPEIQAKLKGHFNRVFGQEMQVV